MKIKEPIYSFDVEIKDGEVKKNYRLQLKSPNRSHYQDADMFYSIQLNKYIKLGLLTSEQVAKRQIDVGGTFTEEQLQDYAKLSARLAEKEEMYLRLTAKQESAEFNEEQAERRSKLTEDIAILRAKIQEYEYVRNSVYDHTANAKARNDTILWWVLYLTNFAEIKEGTETLDFIPMFSGEDFAAKKMTLEDSEDNEDKVVLATFSKLVRIVTYWYWMGVSDKEKLKELMDKEDGII